MRDCPFNEQTIAHAGKMFHIYICGNQQKMTWKERQFFQSYSVDYCILIYITGKKAKMDLWGFENFSCDTMAQTSYLPLEFPVL